MKKAFPMNIILLGDPAAGKATHARHLCARFNLYDLDMGHELRKFKNQKPASPSQGGSKIKTILAKTLDKGKLTPTDIVRKILYDKIHSTPKTQGILFDGTPKMLGEAKLVAKWLNNEKRKKPLVIYLTIPMQETIRRMTERKADFAGKFGKRSDDNKTALKERVKYYRKNIKEVVKFFKKIYEFKKISSDAPVHTVRKALIKLMDSHG